MIRMLNNINLTQIVRQKFNSEGLFLWMDMLLVVSLVLKNRFM